MPEYLYYSVTYEYEAPVVNFPANSWDTEYVYEYSFPEDPYHQYSTYRRFTDRHGKRFLFINTINQHFVKRSF